jgi:hypothetical protein
MCPDCIEFVLERPTDACFVCGRPMTHRGFIKLRQTQKDPHERPAYREFVQGRKLV